MPLRDQQRQKPQQCAFYAQLIAGASAAVGILCLLQAGGCLAVARISGGEPFRQRKATALQRQQVFFCAKILRPAQKLQIKNDVLVFHDAVFRLAQGVQHTRCQHKNIPALRRIHLRAGLHKPGTALYVDQFHAVLPVDRHLPEIPRYRARVNIERKPHRAVVLGFLQGRLVFHGFILPLPPNDSIVPYFAGNAQVFSLFVWYTLGNGWDIRS